MAVVAFEYREPCDSLVEVVGVDNVTGQTVEIHFKPRKEKDLLAIEALGTLGLSQMQNKGLTEEELSASTGVTPDGLHLLARGFIPWAEDRNFAWRGRAENLAGFLAGSDPGLKRMVAVLGFDGD